MALTWICEFGGVHLGSFGLTAEVFKVWLPAHAPRLEIVHSETAWLLPLLDLLALLINMAGKVCFNRKYIYISIYISILDSFMVHFTPRYVCHLLKCIWFFFPCHPHQIENGLLTLWRIFFAGGGESWGRVGWGLENLSKHQVSVPFLSRMLELNMTQTGFQ